MELNRLLRVGKAISNPCFHKQAARVVSALAILANLSLLTGCSSLKNHFLDPSQVGDFDVTTTLDIRSTLSLQDSPGGIPGAIDPRSEDLKPTTQDYRFLPGDTIQIRILELLGSGTETPTQAVIDERGEISMPVLGRLKVASYTPPELETEIIRVLAEKEILKEAQVIVEPVVRRRWVYSIFGAVAAPNVYPLSTPDMKVVDAFNFAGGIPETVEEIYVFRNEESAGASAPRDTINPSAVQATHPPENATATGFHLTEGMESGGRGLLLHAMANKNTKSISSELAKAIRQEPPPPEKEVSGQASEPDHSAATQSTDPATELELQPDAPQSGYIFYDHEWIPTQTQDAAVPVKALTPPASEPGLEAGDAVNWEELVEDEPEQTIIRLSAERLRNGDPRENIVVRPGDVIRSFAGVPGEYFMMGQIQRPGAYSLTGRKVTMMQAVAAAGGLGPLAWPTRCTIYRRYGDRREMQQLNLDRMFAGRDPDLEIKKDDIILVGTHPAAPFLLVLRNSFRMTYGFGFVYDRNFADVDAYNARANPETIEQFQPRFQGIFN